MRQIFYNGIPQRYQWATQPHEKDGTPVALRFAFEVLDVPATTVHLLIEEASQFEIELNSQPVSNEYCGWYLDRAFHKVALPSLAVGTNVLELQIGYANCTELEDCFLLGDFMVNNERAIAAEAGDLYFGGWTTQGYPHYAGAIVYHGSYDYEPRDGVPVKLFLSEYKAVHVAVHVNGVLAGHIPWISANGLDITKYLRPGQNEIGIEVVGSPRNMLGPLHRAAGYESWTGWEAFRCTGQAYTPGYMLHAWGLHGQIRIQRETEGREYSD
jgi:hypothetical protein